MCALYENSLSHTIGNCALVYIQQNLPEKLLLLIRKFILFRNHEYALKGHDPNASHFPLRVGCCQHSHQLLDLLSHFLFSFSYFLNLFICFYFWLCWVFAAACGLSLVVVSRGYSLLRCAGFSWRWLLLLWSTGSKYAGFSSCGSWALERRLSSCGA